MNKQEIEELIFDVLNARSKLLVELDMSFEKRVRFSELEVIEENFIKALKGIK